MLISLAKVIQKQIAEGKYKEATDTWSQLESVISDNSNSVDFYNFLLDEASDPLAVTSAASTVAAASALSSARMTMTGYSSYLSSKADFSGSLEDLMNGVIKQKLNIIPKNVRWILLLNPITPTYLLIAF